MQSKEDQKQLAMAVARAMEKDDAFSQMLGMTLVEAKPGQATVKLKITEKLVNGHGICHGGVIFSLADTAFAYACNSRNHKTVALSCTVSFLSPGKIGQMLTAVAEEQSLKGKTGIYDVAVFSEDEEKIALFRGTSYKMREPVLS